MQRLTPSFDYIFTYQLHVCTKTTSIFGTIMKLASALVLKIAYIYKVIKLIFHESFSFLLSGVYSLSVCILIQFLCMFSHLRECCHICVGLFAQTE